MRRKSFTLIEVLIGMTLFATLLTVLLGVLCRSSYASHTLAKKGETLEELVYARTRIQRLLRAAMPISPRNKKYHCFFTKESSSADRGESLVFSFDNGVQREIPFALHCLARLHVDAEHNLAITSWPTPREGPMRGAPEKRRKEVILPGVASMKMEFFFGTQRKPKPTASNRSVPYKKWVEQWSKEYEILPNLVRLTLTPEKPNDWGEGERTFYFVLPQTIEYISYSDP